MKNKNHRLWAVPLAFLIVTMLFLVYLKPVIFGSPLSEEKCSSFQGVQGDDCWHSLAHQTLNSKFCDNINDNETREHCLGHIPI